MKSDGNQKHMVPFPQKTGLDTVYYLHIMLYQLLCVCELPEDGHDHLKREIIGHF